MEESPADSAACTTWLVMASGYILYVYGNHALVSSHNDQLDHGLSTLHVVHTRCSCTKLHMRLDSVLTTASCCACTHQIVVQFTSQAGFGNNKCNSATVGLSFSAFNCRCLFRLTSDSAGLLWHTAVTSVTALLALCRPRSFHHSTTEKFSVV